MEHGADDLRQHGAQALTDLLTKYGTTSLAALDKKHWAAIVADAS